jgi:hypothetical protein
VAPLIGDVARQPPKAKRQLPAKPQQRPRAGQQDAENDQPLPDFSQRIHGNNRYATFYPKMGAEAVEGRGHKGVASAPR